MVSFLLSVIFSIFYPFNISIEYKQLDKEASLKEQSRNDKNRFCSFNNN